MDYRHNYGIPTKAGHRHAGLRLYRITLKVEIVNELQKHARATQNDSLPVWRALFLLFLYYGRRLSGASKGINV
jgi:hypothetical protein